MTADLAARLAAAEAERDRLRAAVEALADEYGQWGSSLQPALVPALVARRLRALLADAQPEHRRDGKLDRSICGACDGAYIECTACGIYVCECASPCDGSNAQPERAADQPAPAEAPDEREALAAALDPVLPEAGFEGLFEDVFCAIIRAGFRRSPGDLLAEVERRIDLLVYRRCQTTFRSEAEGHTYVGFTQGLSEARGVIRDLRAADAEGSGR